MQDLTSRYQPKILGLVEVRCSEDHAIVVCKKLGFDRWTEWRVLGSMEGYGCSRMIL